MHISLRRCRRAVHGHFSTPCLVCDSAMHHRTATQIVSWQASDGVAIGGYLAQAAQALRAACEQFLLLQLPPEHHADAAAAAGELGALPVAGGTVGVDEQGRGGPAGNQHRGGGGGAR